MPGVWVVVVCGIIQTPLTFSCMWKSRFPRSTYWQTSFYPLCVFGASLKVNIYILLFKNKNITDIFKLYLELVFYFYLFVLFMCIFLEKYYTIIPTLGDVILPSLFSFLKTIFDYLRFLWFYMNFKGFFFCFLESHWNVDKDYSC